MRRNIAEWTVAELYRKRERISFPDYQREPRLWSEKDKALLIDSILNEIDIPSLYLFKIAGKEEYEVIDGQQRLWAIWGYLDGTFACLVDGSRRRFNELDPATQKRILEYLMHVTILSNVEDDYLRTLFIRLQLGLLLNTGEKLHAMTGAMKEFVFGQLVKQPFIVAVKIPERRFAKETLSAQICINAFSRAKIGEFARTRYEDLRAFFEEYSDPKGDAEQLFKTERTRILETCTILQRHFKSRASVLRNRSLILTLFLFVAALRDKPRSSIDATMPTFVAFVEMLIRRLKEEARAGINRSNGELYNFESYLSTAPGEKYQIERRHKKIEDLFEYYKKQGRIKGD